MENNINKLKELYLKKSKHSNYQILPHYLISRIGELDCNIKSTYEKERFEFIIKNIDIKNKNILDIGGNTGFFTFEMISNGANYIDYFEGNNNHSTFVKLASELLNYKKNIKINNKYFNFDIIEKDINNYDITILLNVLHHIGDDYGDNNLSIENAKRYIIKDLNKLSHITNYLILQLGFNWKGNKEFGLFENGTKKEMIEFIKSGCCKYWDIINIGIAEKSNGTIKYEEINDMNIVRNDELGEFLNRPIFIMKSRRKI